MLARLNHPLVANAGLFGGAAALASAGKYLLSVLSDPNELVALYEAAHDHRDPTHALARLVAAMLGFGVALGLSLLLAYLGRPSTLPKGD